MSYTNYPSGSTVYHGAINIHIDSVERTQYASATLTDNFNFTLRQFEFDADIFTVAAAADRIRTAESDLIADFVADPVSAARYKSIVDQQLTVSTAVAASAEKLVPAGTVIAPRVVINNPSDATVVAGGRFSTGIAFDGVTDRLIADRPLIPAYNDFTIEAWIKPDAIGSREYHIFSQYAGPPTDGRFTQFINASGNIVTFVEGVGALTSTAVLSAGTWYHVVFQRRDNTFTVFINGAVQNSAPDTNINFFQGANTTIGSRGTAGDVSFDGTMDEIRISNCARYPTTDISPLQSAPHAPDKNTLLLLHGTGTPGDTQFATDYGTPTTVINSLFAAAAYAIYSPTIAYQSKLIQRAYPYGLFLDIASSLTTKFTAAAAAITLRDYGANLISKFVITDFSEFVDGNVRKFTPAQIATLQENRSYVVDIVEFYTRYNDTDLPRFTSSSPSYSGYQIPLAPVYRWNSSGRDLNLLDYRNTVQNYKGKNVLMTLPSIEYNNLFNKQTVKIQLNGLLGFFQKAITMGWMDHAQVVLGKAILGTIDNPAPTALGITAQVDTVVLLLRGRVNSYVLGNSINRNSITIEISHGFYDYDLINTVRSNSSSYQSYLAKTGYTDSNLAAEPELGTRIVDKIIWGTEQV